MKNLMILILTAFALTLSACQSKSRLTEGAAINCDEVTDLTAHPECVVRAQ